jgi:prolipoprotein diacylglyceryltransferase
MMGEAVNTLLDGIARVRLRIGGREWYAFQVCGTIGVLLSLIIALWLAQATGLSLRVMVTLQAVAVLTFLSMAMAVKILTGKETLVYYQHQIAVLVTTSALVWILGQPVLPYLDLTILGVGIFLVCGRVGCFMAGCCHGRPSCCGVRYGGQHVEAGFTRYYAGVRLLPVQLIEALWVAAVVAIGCALVLRGAAAGSALGWYVMAYGAGRFCLEFLRGDPERPSKAGLSVPQWTSLVLAVLLIAAEWSGIMPFEAWHSVLAALMLSAAVFVAFLHRTGASAKRRIAEPRHIREIAQAITLDATVSETIPVRRTSQGLLISRGRLTAPAGLVEHYTISGAGNSMNEDLARAVCAIVTLLRRSPGEAQLKPGREGIYHILIPAGEGR